MKIGKPWETIADEQLYSRLGMTSTSSRFSDYEDRANKAALHVFINGEPVNRFVREADAEAPAGGVSSSARDLAEWVRLQLSGGKWNGKQIIDATPSPKPTSPRSVAIRSTRPSPMTVPADQYYGLGWDVGTNSQGHTQVSHSGAFFLGAATAVYLVPDEHIGVLVLSNSMPIGLPESICLHFLDLVHYGKPQREYLPLLGKLFSGMIAEHPGCLAELRHAGAAEDLGSRQAAQRLYRHIHERIFRDARSLRPGQSPDPATSSARQLTTSSRLGTATPSPTTSPAKTPAPAAAAQSSRRTKNQVLIENLSPEHNAVFTGAACK